MSKIITKLLELKFPNTPTTSLMEIINATPNPELATEILCGLYEEPTIYTQSLLKYYKNIDGTRAIGTFISYDKWTNTIYYSYDKPEKLSFYVPKDFDISILTIENYMQYKVSYDNSGGTKTTELFTGKISSEKGNTNLEDWNSEKIINNH